jgi:ferredoxin
MRVTVDRTKCIGAGQCRDIAPAVFGANTDGTAYPKNETPDVSQHANVTEAWETCPSGAIEISESED